MKFNPEKAESMKDKAYLCKCGCGGYVRRLKSQYILGHHTRRMKKSTKKKISASLRKYYETSAGKENRSSQV